MTEYYEKTLIPPLEGKNDYSLWSLRIVNLISKKGLKRSLMRIAHINIDSSDIAQPKSPGTLKCVSNKQAM